jgi:hypothetical protein
MHTVAIDHLSIRISYVFRHGKAFATSRNGVLAGGVIATGINASAAACACEPNFDRLNLAAVEPQPPLRKNRHFDRVP